MSREERERRRMIQHWARFMIIHLDRSEFDAKHYSYAQALERLRDLIGRELDRIEARV